MSNGRNLGASPLLGMLLGAAMAAAKEAASADPSSAFLATQEFEAIPEHLHPMLAEAIKAISETKPEDLDSVVILALKRNPGKRWCESCQTEHEDGMSILSFVAGDEMKVKALAVGALDRAEASSRPADEVFGPDFAGFKFGPGGPF